MAMEKLGLEFEQLSEANMGQILNLLVTYDKNIKMKTENNAPLEMSAIDAIIPRLKKLKLKKSSTFTENLRDSLDQRMCSKGRGSRNELIRAISESRQNTEQNRGVLDRILGRNKAGGL